MVGSHCTPPLLFTTPLISPALLVTFSTELPYTWSTKLRYDGDLTESPAGEEEEEDMLKELSKLELRFWLLVISTGGKRVLHGPEKFKFELHLLALRVRGMTEEVVFVVDVLLGLVCWLTECLSGRSARVTGEGEIQECERDLWTAGLAFLNILHMAHASCSTYISFSAD